MPPTFLGKNNGVDFTTVMTGGGKASLNAVVADDVDIGWSAGAQTAAVKAGEITNLASAEIEPLLMQPDAPQVQDFNLPYDFGVKFIVVAPAGIPEEARENLAAPHRGNPERSGEQACAIHEQGLRRTGRGARRRIGDAYAGKLRRSHKAARRLSRVILLCGPT